MKITWSLNKFTIHSATRQCVADILEEIFAEYNVESCFINEIDNCFSPLNMTLCATCVRGGIEKKYIIRINNANITDIVREIFACLLYGRLGVSPQVIYSNNISNNLGIIVMEYVNNDPTRFELEHINDNLICKLAALFKKIHIPVHHRKRELQKIHLHNPVYDFVIRKSYELIADHPHLNWLNQVLYYANFLQKVMAPYSRLFLTHNDIHPANMLFDNTTETLYAIDWESSAIGDPLFDLATASVFLRLNKSQEQLLLTEYYACVKLTEEQAAHYFLVKQWVYLYYAPGPIICKTSPIGLSSTKRRELVPFYDCRSALAAIHPAKLSSLDCLRVSIMFANAAFFAINSHDYINALGIILSLHAAQYDWLNHFNREPYFLPIYVYAGVSRFFDQVSGAAEDTMFLHDLIKLTKFSILMQNILLRMLSQAFELNNEQKTYVNVLLRKAFLPLLVSALNAVHGEAEGQRVHQHELKGPFFIVFEGGRASGKTTQIAALKEHLEQNMWASNKVVVEKANNDVVKPLLEQLLAVLDISDPTTPESRLPSTFLFQGLLTMQTRRIVSLLQQGKMVIADRWKDSYYVHNILQSPFKSVGPNTLCELNQLIFSNLRPDVRILLDVSTPVAQKRVGQRNRADKLTASSATFLDESRRKFLLCFQSEGYIINTDSKSESEIFAEILNIIKFQYDLRMMSNYFEKINRKTMMSGSHTFFKGESQLRDVMPGNESIVPLLNL